MKKLFAVFAVMLVFNACAPQVDIEAERAAIRNISDVEWLQAALDKDVERSLSFFADDASMLYPNTPIATGKEAMRALDEREFAAPRSSLSWQTSQIEVARSGDLAYSRGTYEFTMNGPDGQPITDRGKFVVVWKKVDGTWKVVADVPNSDLPPRVETAIWTPEQAAAAP